MSGKSPIAPVIALTIIVFTIFYFSPAQSAQAEPLIYWVYDAGRADSQFGYTQGTQSSTLGPVYEGHDLEGIACLAGALYASSGGDGDTLSQLYKVTTDLAAGQADIQTIGVISTGNDPYFEVASLAEKDGKFWGYAAEGAWQGILQIDPTTAQATRVYTPTKAVDVSSVAWISGTLYLGARDKVYAWQPGLEITYLFTTTLEQIEAMDGLDGKLNLAGDGVDQIQVYSPAGEYEGHRIAAIPPDIESLTFCGVTTSPTVTPTATATHTPAPAVTITPGATPTVATPTATPVSPTAGNESAEPRTYQIYVDLDMDNNQGAGEPAATDGSWCLTSPLDGDVIKAARMYFVSGGQVTFVDLELNTRYEVNCEDRLFHTFDTSIGQAGATTLAMAPLRVWAPAISK